MFRAFDYEHENYSLGLLGGPRLPLCLCGSGVNTAGGAMKKGNGKQDIVQAIRESTIGKVKVAVSDIDGILRGKLIHRDKFFSAVEGGFGFCDVVFGWDMHDQCYDNTKLTGWHHGFPDALARLDLATHRQVPWDNNVDFFLGDFVTADG